jgi:hypothetical protein
MANSSQLNIPRVIYLRLGDLSYEYNQAYHVFSKCLTTDKEACMATFTIPSHSYRYRPKEAAVRQCRRT